MKPWILQKQRSDSVLFVISDDISEDGKSQSRCRVAKALTIAIMLLMAALWSWRLTGTNPPYLGGGISKEIYFKPVSGGAIGSQDISS
jgi:hypothetical protein